MLQIIISKFPEELVNDWCEVFFLPLVQRLTGDPSSKCREAVGATLKALMHRVAPDPLDKLAQYCLIWLGGGDARLARTAAQVGSGCCIASPTTLFDQKPQLAVGQLKFAHIELCSGRVHT